MKIQDINVIIEFFGRGFIVIGILAYLDITLKMDVGVAIPVTLTLWMLLPVINYICTKKHCEDIL